MTTEVPVRRLNVPRNPEKVAVDRAETVRCMIWDTKGRMLLLQKDTGSRNKGMFEFPGGKIESIQGPTATLDEQRAAVINEVREETRIDIKSLPIARLRGSHYSFVSEGTRFDRTVHLYTVLLQKNDPTVTVNQTTRVDGRPEDNHSGFRWVTREEYARLHNEDKIAANSLVYISF